jgi:hypothetical protein
MAKAVKRKKIYKYTFLQRCTCLILWQRHVLTQIHMLIYIIYKMYNIMANKYSNENRYVNIHFTKIYLSNIMANFNAKRYVNIHFYKNILWQRQVLICKYI